MIEQIKIQGVNYPVRVGYYAIKMASLELEAQGKPAISMDDIKGQDISVFEPLLYYGIIMGMKTINRSFQPSELPFTREDMPFIVDEVFTEFIKKMPKFLYVNQDAAEGGAESTGKKLKPEKGKKETPEQVNQVNP